MRQTLARSSPRGFLKKISTPHSSGSIFPKNLAFVATLPFHGSRNKINILRPLDA